LSIGFFARSDQEVKSACVVMAEIDRKSRVIPCGDIGQCTRRLFFREASGNPGTFLICLPQLTENVHDRGVCNKPKRSPNWRTGFKHLSDVQRYCRNYGASWRNGPTPLARVWCESLFIRAVAAINSVAVLIDHNCVDDAAIIVRTLFEIEFQIGAIKKDPNVAAQLIGWTEVERLARLKNFSKVDGIAMPEGMSANELEQKLEEARKFAKKLTKEALANLADRKKEYERFYRTLCEIAHASALGLRHYFQEAGPGNLFIKSDGSLYSAELVMALASATLLEILNFVRDLRGDRIDAELQSLLMEHENIIGEILTRTR
jgi:hypothetical protein